MILSETLVLKTALLVDLCFESQIWHFIKQWIPGWLSNRWVFCFVLVFTETTSLKTDIRTNGYVQFSLYDLMLYTTFHVSFKGISHRGFSRFKRTEYLENQHSECMDAGLGITTLDEIFKKNPRICSLPYPVVCGITSARYRTKVSMRSDIGVNYLCPIPLNAYIFKNLNLSLKSS